MKENNTKPIEELKEILEFLTGNDIVKGSTFYKHMIKTSYTPKKLVRLKKRLEEKISIEKLNQEENDLLDKILSKEINNVMDVSSNEIFKNLYKKMSGVSLDKKILQFESYIF